MKELESVLEKVESKLLLSRKVYAALTYQIWLVIMAGYYLLIGPMHSVSTLYPVIYWTVGIVIYFILSEKIIRRIEALWSEEKSLKYGYGFTASWLIAAILGWFIIPLYLPLPFLSALSVGLLSFIALANLGMILSIYIAHRSVEWEMLPGTMIPAAMIPTIPYLSVNPMYYAGMAVVAGYGLCVVLYLYSAFRYAG